VGRLLDTVIAAGRCVKCPPPTFLYIMATTTFHRYFTYATIAFATVGYLASSDDALDSSFPIRHAVRSMLTRFRGRQPLTLAQERKARLLQQGFDQAEDLGDSIADELMFEVVDGADGARRPRRALRAHYAHRLVRHVRGEVGQRRHNEANVLVVERHARAKALADGVRPQDLSVLMPLVLSIYFWSRSKAQIEAQALQQSAAFVKSTFARLFEGVCGRQSSQTG